jgi:hypothetical protein
MLHKKSAGKFVVRFDNLGAHMANSIYALALATIVIVYLLHDCSLTTKTNVNNTWQIVHLAMPVNIAL